MEPFNVNVLLRKLGIEVTVKLVFTYFKPVWGGGGEVSLLVAEPELGAANVTYQDQEYEQLTAC